MTFGFFDVVVLLLLAIGVVLATARLWLGPYAPDRIVAADTLSVIATALIAFLAQTFESSLFLDVALLYGVLAFVGVIALARTIEGNKA